MVDRPDITLDDLKTLARGQAPDLAQAIIHFAAQPQPEPENVPEGRAHRRRASSSCSGRADASPAKRSSA